MEEMRFTLKVILNGVIIKLSSNIKWSEELFKIHSINRSNVVTYKIKDLNDEIIEGIFYERELQKTRK